VQLGIVSCKECAGQTNSQSCDSEQSVGRLLLQECAESKDFNTEASLKGCHKECVQEVSKKTEFGKKLRRNRPLNPLKDKHREVAIGSPREASQVCEQVSESCGGNTSSFHGFTKGRANGQNPWRRFSEVP
jgi:hypothetical protein